MIVQSLPRLRWAVCNAAVLLAVAASGRPARAATDAHAGMDMHDGMEGMEGHGGMEAHAGAHAPVAATTQPVKSMREYVVPPVQLVREDGKRVSLPQEMDDGRPVLLNFIFTTCSDICPMMSSVFSQFQHRLGTDAGKVHIMSISIDPEQDTPTRLVEYAHRFHAGPEWQHYTGTREASITAQRAFGVYRGGKMSHGVVTLMRAAPGKPWLRIDGFVSPDDLVQDYRELIAGR